MKKVTNKATTKKIIKKVTVEFEIVIRELNIQKQVHDERSKRHTQDKNKNCVKINNILMN